MHRHPTPSRDARLLLWHCPICDLDDDGVDPSCLNCHGIGFVDLNGISGFQAEARPAPRPPAVRPGPCVDCACRNGSPEEDSGAVVLDAAKPFFCHEGMPLVGGEYQPTAWSGNLPLGYLVCGGWWQWATTGTLPAQPYRERHEPGSDQ